MRPTRLDLDGFASFRQPTALDFTDADLFVLSGPTGAGKSSIIDGIVFSLYGVVPRYDDKRLVAPVISDGRNEARVRLQFLVGGQPYTAVRVVRRTTTGASTKEARLERWRGSDPRDADVVAATADEVTTAVEAILGLGYEHFTTTVVLPQGAFQRFLQAKPSERQSLLVQLLDLDVYGRIGRQARARATTEDARVAVLSQHLDATQEPVTEQVVAAAGERIEALSRGLAAVDRARPELDRILEEGRDRATQVARFREEHGALREVTMPDDLDDVATAVTTATAAAERADVGQRQARSERRRLDELVDRLPGRDAVRVQRDRLARQAVLTTEVAEAAVARDRAQADLDQARADLEDAEAAAVAARRDLDAARELDLVATLAAGVHVGDPCPVCRRPLDDEVDTPDGVLAHAREHLRRVEAGVDRARRRFQRSGTDTSAIVERHRQLVVQHDRLVAEVSSADLPTDPDELVALAAQLDQAAVDRQNARVAEADADRAVEQAASGMATARRSLEATRDALDVVRDRVAALRPPALPRHDVVTAWTTLRSWVDDELPRATQRLHDAEQATTQARQDYGERFARLRHDLDGLDVDLAGANQAGEVRDRIVAARAAATTAHERLVERRDDQRRRQAELATARHGLAVSTELGRLLNRNNFEKWLLARAVNRLVAGASHHLRDLTQGAYTLRLLPDASFGIVDHANGGALRSARTLSGGETFLASLSLALSLSDHVADFAAEGAARLESLFIDEGFGTLDASTVDVVRTALEDLGSTGRMVGVVTHVQALAEQLPVQFRVRKESQSSRVDRVDR